MGIRTRITQVARERGLTAAEVARRLGLYRSNLSAMDKGRRPPSLKMLARLTRALHCGPVDLLEEVPDAARPLFRRSALNRRLERRDLDVSAGEEKGWVHAVLLAWQRHHRAIKRTL